MKNLVEYWYDSIRQNKIRATNIVADDKLSLCCNFIQIPGEDVVAFTITVMMRQRKRTALDPQQFAATMRIIEKGLRDIQRTAVAPKEQEPFLFTTMSMQLPDKWYSQLNVHRVFFLPVNAVFDMMKVLLKQNCKSALERQGVAGITLVVDTNDYLFSVGSYA